MRESHLLLFLMIALSSCQSPSVDRAILNVAEDVRAQFAPDKRTAIFSVDFTQEGDTVFVSGETDSREARDALLSELSEMGINYQSDIKTLPSNAELGDHIYGLVLVSVCNIRSEPRHSAELSTQATLGTPLRLLKREGDWFLVQTPDEYLGWLDKGSFASLDRSAMDRWKAADKVVFMPDYGFSYRQPDPASLRLGDLVTGNILRSDGRAGNMTRVVYPDGQLAFVPSSDLMDYRTWIEQLTPSREHILSSALRFSGRPYLWGGTSGKAFDCSGFTKTVFYLNGLILPRDASQQVRAGRQIETDTASLANLQAGDFLFFGYRATDEKPERVTHVAIYLGDGKIIHASGSTASVAVQSLRRGDPDFAEGRLETFLQARRMLTENISEGLIRLTDSPDYAPFVPGES